MVTQWALSYLNMSIQLSTYACKKLTQVLLRVMPNLERLLRLKYLVA